MEGQSFPFLQPAFGMFALGSLEEPETLKCPVGVSACKLDSTLTYWVLGQGT
jgi:hypothetical protein